MESVADTIRNARRAAGLSQAELAKAVGTSQPAISRYEQGRAVPSRNTVERIVGFCARQRRRPREVLVDHRREVIDVLKKYGASKVLVFGSVARGEDDEGSDVDLLVDHFDKGAYTWGVPKAQKELEALLGVKVDVGEVQHLRPRVLAEAMRDVRPL
jgi:hypothetical protein